MENGRFWGRIISGALQGRRVHRGELSVLVKPGKLFIFFSPMIPGRYHSGYLQGIMGKIKSAE
jgi:hypothetical protein